MRDRKLEFVLGIAFLIALCFALSCSSGPTIYKAPCCGEEECDTYESEVIESTEEPDLTRDYELESVDPLLATKCLTCGIHFTHPSYGEHIKTCCP